jgi:hypothetical protein
MPEKGQLPGYRRRAHGLLGADSDLPAAVIKPPPVHRTKNELEVDRIYSLACVTITPSVR